MPKITYLLRRIAEMDKKAVWQTARKVHKRSGKSTLSAFVDIVRCGFTYGAGYMDYLVFEFDALTPAQRATYVTRGKNNAYVSRFNPKEHWHILEDKAAFLAKIGPLAGRDWLDLRTDSLEQFRAFCEKHRKFAVKPLDATCGRGIEFPENVTDPDALYAQCKESGQVLVEEYVVQHPEVSAIYPHSVNTLRFCTILCNGKVHLVFSSLRIGNGKTVDNLNAGGMAVLVGEDGRISTVGADKDGVAYETHPMTGVTLKGTPIPFYQESVDMVKAAAAAIPELGYIAWDVAVTETGPLLIEANHFPGHDIYQFQVHLGPDKLGLVPRFEAACKE